MDRRPHESALSIQGIRPALSSNDEGGVSRLYLSNNTVRRMALGEHEVAGSHLKNRAHGYLLATTQGCSTEPTGALSALRRARDGVPRRHKRLGSLYGVEPSLEQRRQQNSIRIRAHNPERGDKRGELTMTAAMNVVASKP
jgi:hypothetical protein